MPNMPFHCCKQREGSTRATLYQSWGGGNKKNRNFKYSHLNLRGEGVKKVPAAACF